MTAGPAAAVPGAAATPFPDPQAVAAAHARLRADPTIQFDFPWQKAPRETPPPQWLIDLFRAIDRLISWVGERGWTILFWILLAAIVLVLLYLFVPPVRAWLLRLARRGRPPAEATGDWTPEAGTARSLLEEADALAAAGRYDEAIHLLLFRSIEDIARWRGDLLRPSLTSRDIARAEALPERARGVFGRIAALVERSLFAGHPLAASDWERARAEYSGFALRGA